METKAVLTRDLLCICGTRMIPKEDGGYYCPLHAAAPDLLEACQAASFASAPRTSEDARIPYAVWKQLSAAIAKAKGRITMVTNREIAQIIRKDGYYKLDELSTGSYSGAIIACRVRGFAHVDICCPYGGSPHFAVASETGAWHTRGLDWEEAAKYCPRYGESIASILSDLT